MLAYFPGPLLDRFDLRVHVPAVEQDALMNAQVGESSATIAQRVWAARQCQYERQGSSNGRITIAQLEAVAQVDADGRKLLDMAMRRFELSARAYHRVLKVSRTIADLAQSESIQSEHIAEALQYRGVL